MRYIKSHFFAAAFLSMSCFHANAGFERWSTEVENDPFSEGEKVTANHMTSIRSGVFVVCDSADSGIEVRSIAGWEYSSDVPKFATSAIAVDGKVLLKDILSATGAFGQNVAGVIIPLNPDSSKILLEAFVKAQKQIAIKDGISNSPMLLTARGSTKAAQTLLECLNKQK